MNIKGTITEIYDTQQVSEKFKKREFVIQDKENPEYPQYIKFELSQDKCSLANNLNVGDNVDVSFNLRGRSYVNPQGVKSYFNSLQCWKIGIEAATHESTIGEKRDAQEQAMVDAASQEDGLPF